MKTTITSNTNLNAAELRNALMLYGIENIPAGVKTETLIDLYGAAVLEAVNTSLKAETEKGEELADVLRAALRDLPTIESVDLFAEEITALFFNYSHGADVATIDDLTENADFNNAAAALIEEAKRA